MSKFTYVGDMDHNATIVVDNKKIDLRLSKGEEYMLPESHRHILQLVTNGLLVVVAPLPETNTVTNK